MARLLYAKGLGGATLDFSSGFGEGVTLETAGAQTGFGGGNAFQRILGTDSKTKGRWPFSAMQTGTSQLQLLTTNGAVTNAAQMDVYEQARIRDMPGPYGKPAKALHLNMASRAVTSTGGAQQLPLYATPTPATILAEGVFYVEMDMQLQPNLASILNGWTGWTVIWEFKEGGNVGYYRVASYVYSNGTTLYWFIHGDNAADNGGNPDPYAEYWNLSNATVAVPTGQWFHLEFLIDRKNGGTNAVIWQAVNGREVFYKTGVAMTGAAVAGKTATPIGRLMMPNVYTETGQAGAYPHYKYITNLKIWRGGWPGGFRTPVFHND